MSVHAYLNFNGNCRQAMQFYQDCLGGDLHFQTLAESPLASEMPAAMRKLVLHARLVNHNIVLAGTDLLGEQALIKGNAISLMLQCHSEQQLRSLYQKLSEGGAQTLAPSVNAWGNYWANLTDRFGYQWVLTYQESISSETPNLILNGRGI